MEDHAMNTWREPQNDSGRLWLRDDLPAVAPLAHIFNYEYDATAVFGEGQEGFIMGASELLETLKSQGMDGQTRPLILFGHSLGGFLILQALVSASKNPMYSNIRQTM